MEQTKAGKIIKGLGGLYSVRIINEDNSVSILSCRGKGAFRHDEQKLMVGDNVEVRFDPEDIENTAVIRDIQKRTNSLIRPPLSNLDYLFCCIASTKPAPVLETLDKLLCIAEYNGIEPVLIITKSDFSEEETNKYREIYTKAGFTVFSVSVEDGSGIEDLNAFLKEHIKDGKVAAFAGASGVGKSTLLNALFPNLSLQTNSISERVERGRHTTRHVELFEVFGEGTTAGFLADTPGFSMLDFMHFDFFKLEDLFDSFREFSSKRGECKYLDCSHTGEGPEECAIAKAVLEGEISSTRHESYKTLYKTLFKKKYTFH